MNVEALAEGVSQSQLRAGRVLTYGIAVGVLSGLLLLDVSPILTTLRQQFGIDYGLAGWAISATLIAHTLVQVPVGQWGERVGLKIVILSAVALMGISVLVRAAANTFALLLLSRAITGLGTGMVFAGNVLLVSAFSPPYNRARDQGILGAAQYFGIAGAMLVMPLASATIGLRPLYLVIAGLSVLLFVVLARALPQLAAVTDGNTTTPSLLAAFRSALAIELGVANILSYATYMTLVSWAATFLSTRFATVAQTTALLAMAITLAGFLGRLSGGFIARRVSPRVVIFGSALFTALLLVLVTLTTTLPLAVVTLLATAYMSNLAFGPIFSYTRSGADATTPGQRLAVIVVISSTASFVLPLIIGYILRFTASFSLAFVFLALLVLGIAVLLFRYGQLR